MYVCMYVCFIVEEIGELIFRMKTDHAVDYYGWPLNIIIHNVI